MAVEHNTLQLCHILPDLQVHTCRPLHSRDTYVLNRACHAPTLGVCHGMLYLYIIMYQH